MAYVFDYLDARDPTNPAVRAADASITIFAPGDPTMAPLTLTTVDGQPYPNPVTTNADGYAPQPVHETLDQIAWSGGGLTGTMVAYKGIKDEAVAAREAAEAAVELAQAPTDAQVDAGITRANIPAIAATVVAGNASVVSSAATMAQSTAGLVPVWKASTAYTAGQRVIAPNGDVVSAKVNFTSGATYSASNWNASTQDGRLGTIETIQLPDRGRATVASHTSADNITTNGAYQIWSSTDATGLGLPSPNGGEVKAWNYGTVLHQSQLVLESTGWQLYLRRRSGGVFTAWEAPFKTALNTAKWEKTGALAGTTNLDTLASGLYHVYSSQAALDLGLPVVAGGVLEKIYVTTTAMILRYSTFGAPQQNWQREKNSGTWGAWRRLDTPPSVTADIPGSGFKVVPLAVTLPSTGSKYQYTARTERHLMRWNAPVTRWRAHLRNFDYRMNQSLPGAVNFTGLWFGEHDTTSGLSGAYKTAPVQVAGAKTVTDGAEWVTSWINQPIEAGKEYLLSYGYTTAAGVELFLQVGNVYASNSSTAAGVQAAPGGTGGALLDVWIEAETYATTPVIAALGDSLSSGVGASYGVRDSWLSQYTWAKKALPLHYTASGDSYGGWTNPAWEKWTRWQYLAKPDALIAALGSNDVFQNVTTAQFQAWFSQVIVGLKTVASPNLYLATIMPRSNATGAVETVRREVNTWLRTLPEGARDIFDFAAAASADDETIRPEFDADGVHLNTAGYATVAAAVTRPVTAPPVMYQTV